MTIAVSEFKTNISNVLSKYAPKALKTIVHCGFEAAKLPLESAKNLANEFSGYKSDNLIGDSALNFTQTVTEKVSEKTSEWSLNISNKIANKIAERF